MTYATKIVTVHYKNNICNNVTYRCSLLLLMSIELVFCVVTAIICDKFYLIRI